MKKARKIIIFEGIDGSGKSTLENAYRSWTGYYDFTIHRFTGSKYVYDTFHNRGTPLSELIFDEKNLIKHFDVRLVLCLCSADIALERLQKRPDDEVNPIYYYQRTQELFREYWSLTQFDAKIRINTDVDSVDKCVQKLMYFTGLPYEEACNYDS